MFLQCITVKSRSVAYNIVLVIQGCIITERRRTLIKETCIAQLNEEIQKNPGAKFYICLRDPPTDIQYETGKIGKCMALSPSKNLTRDFRSCT